MDVDPAPQVLAMLYISSCYMSESAPSTAVPLLANGNKGAVAYYGEGYHAWDVTPENYKQVMKVRRRRRQPPRLPSPRLTGMCAGRSGCTSAP